MKIEFTHEQRTLESYHLHGIGLFLTIFALKLAIMSEQVQVYMYLYSYTKIATGQNWIACKDVLPKAQI